MVTSYLVGATSLALLCGAWALFQRWMVVRDPTVRGPEDSIGACKKACGDCDQAAGPGQSC